MKIWRIFNLQTLNPKRLNLCEFITDDGRVCDDDDAEVEMCTYNIEHNTIQRNEIFTSIAQKWATRPAHHNGENRYNIQNGVHILIF